MAKFTVLLASLAALLLLADASIYRTTVVIDEDANQSRESCQEQIRRQHNLRDCQQYIRQQSRERRRYDVDDVPNQRREESLRMCCQQLERLDSRCRCDGLEQAVRQQREQLRGEELREAFQMAEDIPSRCGVSPGQCQFESRRGF